MSAQLQAVPATAQAFVRRTALQDDEYRVNFKQLDNAVIAALVSPAARAVTPLMSTIYLSLLAAPPECWERDGVLRFTGATGQDERLTAWQQLRQLTGVANSTLAKALKWLHTQSIIGYVAHKNGVGIRIFLNRAASSIRTRTGQKNLRLINTPFDRSDIPAVGTLSNEKGIRNIREEYSAPAREAEHLSPALKLVAVPPAAPLPAVSPEMSSPTQLAALANHVTNRVVAELKPSLTAAANRELNETREWLLNHALPKATRIAQRETYDLLRAHGVLAKKPADNHTVGRGSQAPVPLAGPEREGAKLAGALQAWGRELEQLVTATDVNDPVKAACQRASTRLFALQALIPPNGQCVVSEVETQLLAVERELSTELWQTCSAAEQVALEQSARAALHVYATRMDEDTFAETVRRRIAKVLRERMGIPRLGLLYL